MPYRRQLTMTPLAGMLAKGRLPALLMVCAPRARIIVVRFLLKQISWGNFQNLGKGGDHIDGRTINASLKRAYICPVNTSLMRKFLLRQSLCVSHHSKIARKNFTNVHIRSHARRGAFIYGVNSTICRLRHALRLQEPDCRNRTSGIRPVVRQLSRGPVDVRNWPHGFSMYQTWRIFVPKGSIAKRRTIKTSSISLSSCMNPAGIRPISTKPSRR